MTNEHNNGDSAAENSFQFVNPFSGDAVPTTGPA
jgi:hypothetical protein